MGGIRFCRWGCHSENLFVCFGVKPTQRAQREIFHETRSRWGKEGLREDRRRHSAEWSRRGQSAWEGSQEKDTVSRREQQTPVDRTGQSRDESALLVALWEFSLEYTLALAHRIHKKCDRIPSLLRLELTQSVFVRLFFSSTFLFVLWVFVEKCEIHLARDEKKPLDESVAMSGLRELR